MDGKPVASSEEVSARMSRQARKDTAPELELRKELWSRGLRYRLQYPVPGQSRRSIDMAFPGKRVAVFVDGCFWHGCRLHSVNPRSNSEWWRSKIDANRARDADTTAHLVNHGWEVVRCWEHDDPVGVADFVEILVKSLR